MRLPLSYLPQPARALGYLFGAAFVVRVVTAAAGVEGGWPGVVFGATGFAYGCCLALDLNGAARAAAAKGPAPVRQRVVGHQPRLRARLRPGLRHDRREHRGGEPHDRHGLTGPGAGPASPG
jgi:hypothetical protein